MKSYLNLVKFSHTIFAMPFAMIGLFLAYFLNDLSFRWSTLALVLLCMVLARNAAMAFNRYLDRDIDKLNPRTAEREIPAGIISSDSALYFVIINSLLFIGLTFFINKLCANAFHLIPVVYGMAVLFWVSGFDIIYALQDENFDREHQLNSTPVALGKPKALLVSRLFHICCAALLIYNGILLQEYNSNVGHIHWIAVILFIGLLIFQHRLVSPTKLDKINLAFFTTNGVASVLFGILVILDFYI